MDFGGHIQVEDIGSEVEVGEGYKNEEDEMYELMEKGLIGITPEKRQNGDGFREDGDDEEGFNSYQIQGYSDSEEDSSIASDDESNGTRISETDEEFDGHGASKHQAMMKMTKPQLYEYCYRGLSTATFKVPEIKRGIASQETIPYGISPAKKFKNNVEDSQSSSYDSPLSVKMVKTVMKSKKPIELVTLDSDSE